MACKKVRVAKWTELGWGQGILRLCLGIWSGWGFWGCEVPLDSPQPPEQDAGAGIRLYVELPAQVPLSFLTYVLLDPATGEIVASGQLAAYAAAGLVLQVPVAAAEGLYQLHIVGPSRGGRLDCGTSADVRLATSGTAPVRLRLKCLERPREVEDGGLDSEVADSGEAGYVSLPTDGAVVADAGEPQVGTDQDGAAPLPEPVCGNGILESGEQCDDGTGSNYDVCKDDSADGGHCELNICGDGVLLVGVEVCDDGNQSNADGCKDDPSAGGDCSPNYCGDGVVDAAREECDEGSENGLRRDSPCTSTCRLLLPAAG